MTVKDTVLLALWKESPGELSGEVLAQQTGVTRAAVWKAVEALRKEGYDIQSSGGKGYVLISSGRRLCIPCIEEELQSISTSFAVHYFDAIDSTNAEAKRRIAAGEKAPMLLIAGSQQAGRGRLGRDFYSPEGGLYMSLAVADFPLLEGGVRYTSAAALAAALSLEELLGEPIGIKWVNDLYYRGKKISGILTEGIFDLENARLSHLIVGIGINTSSVDFPQEIQNRAGYVPLEPRQKTDLVIHFVRRLMDLFSRIDDPGFFDGYRERCFLLGKEVQFQKENRHFRGRAVGIDDWGGLIVATEEGELTLQSGEVFLSEEVSADFQLRAESLHNR